MPSPNVSDDHQTKNALALSNNNAALVIKDVDAREQLIGTCIGLLGDTNKCNELTQNIKQLGVPNAAERIVNEIEKITQKP